MNKSLKYGFIFGVLLMALLVVWLSSGPIKPLERKRQFVSSNWDEKFKWDSQHAYGLQLMDELLTELNDNRSPKKILDYDSFDTVPDNPLQTTYFFLGGELGLLDEELDTLLGLVYSGADLFVSASDFTTNFSEAFDPYLTYSFEYAPQISVKLDTSRYKFTFLFQGDTLAYPWHVIHRKVPLSATTKVLSRISGEPNFMKFQYGEGSVFIHSTPELFFNYNLASKDGYFHASQVVRQLDPKKELVYLELARLDDAIEEDLFDFLEEDSEGERDDSYLQFLFQTPAMRAALLLTVAGFLLFLLFRSKRMRPVVPVRTAKRNISVVFVQTIASIYRSRDNAFSVLLLIRKNFYNTVKKHYFIDLSRRNDGHEIRHLAERSGIPETEIEELLKKLESSNVALINEDYLLDVSRQKRSFYERAGIINDRILQRLEQKELIFYRQIWFSYPLILIGISAILFGLYLLVDANANGVLLWPIGILLLVIGILRMSKPLLQLRFDEIIYTPLFGRRQTFKHDALSSYRHHNQAIELRYTDDTNLMIPLSELSSGDRKQLELFLIRKQIIEL